MASEYRRFWITSRAPGEQEGLLALAFEAGASGVEESDREGDSRALVYAPSNVVEGIRARLESVAAASTEIGLAEAVPTVDWTQAWKEGIESLRISDRLVIRPSFVSASLEPGQREVVIDPGQAFGTGSHPSTRLCLEWIDVLSSERGEHGGFERVLDAGTGSGILALAALALGARSALGFDVDPVAIEAARQAARENGAESRVEFRACGIDRLARDVHYSLVVANLLKREVLPIAAPLVDRMQEDGVLILSGLLEEDVSQVLARFAAEGWVESRERRTIEDATGIWVGLCLARKRMG